MPDLGKLREQIAAGEYRLDASAIASALLDYASDECSASMSDAREDPFSRGSYVPHTGATAQPRLRPT